MIGAIAAIFLGAALQVGSGRSAVNVRTIVQQSMEVTEADQKANSEYDYDETDLESDGSKKTYSVHMLFGSPYRELIAVNGRRLSKDDQEQQHRKLQQEISRRQHESPNERAHRIAQYQNEQARDRRFIEEFPKAFDFGLVGEQQLDHRQVYILRATPRAGYRPVDKESKVLTGMRGKLWIDKQTHQWVKVEAEVIHPVSIEGFLAMVEPGTRFELEKMPVEGNIWLPRHFAMTAKAKVLALIHHKNQEDETFFNYHKAAQKPGVSG
jgi:hypothetical protein